jgi:hypothetical protein
MPETPEWDSKDIAAEFHGISTVEMLRVARMTVTEFNTYRWVATAPGVTWSYANDSWTSECPPEIDETFRPHDFDEDFFRYLLGEQLVNEGVTRQSPLWHRY